VTKVIMLVSHAASFKVFNELKQYLYVKGYNDIDLSYYYFPLRFAYYDSNYIIPIFPNHNINVPAIYNHHAISTDVPQEELYLCQKLADVVEYLLQITSNFINNRPLDYNLESCSWTHSKKFVQYKKSKIYDASDILSIVDNIPKADIYLFTHAENASAVVQYLLIFNLIRKYNSHVLLGGGENLNYNNPETILLNKISENYLDNKLHKCSGDIGPTLINFLNNKEYSTSYVDIHDYFIKPWVVDFTPYELHEICGDTLYLSTVYGCSGRCPYCVGSNLHPYTSLENLEYYKDILEYISDVYPEVSITFFDTELNRDKDRFNTMLEWLIQHNIKNKLSFFINLSRLDKDSLNLIKQINVNCINSAFDGMFEYNVHRHSISTQDEFSIINNLDSLKKIVLNQGGTLAFNSVMFIPNSLDLLRYRDDPSFVTNVAMQYVKYASDLALDFNLYDLKLNSDMYFNKDKYNIKVFNYQNKKFKDLHDIDDAINNIPIFFTYDLPRKERTRILHQMFMVWKKYDFLTLNNIMSRCFDNKYKSNFTGYKSYKKLDEDMNINGYIELASYVLQDMLDMFGPNDDIVQYIMSNIR